MYRAFESLEGFRMYTHCGRVGAIPTYRLSEMMDSTYNYAEVTNELRPRVCTYY